jgi:hypothetical protein
MLVLAQQSLRNAPNGIIKLIFYNTVTLKINIICCSTANQKNKQFDAGIS